MTAPLKALFNQRRVALTKARLKAWWNGADFDEEAALAAIEAAANETAGADEELFDEPPYDMPARLGALMRLWGEGRLRPGDDTLEALEPARLGLAPEGLVAFLSPGLAGPLIALAKAHPGKIDAFEWRDETVEALKYGVRQAKLEDRVSVTRVDLEAHVWPLAHYDGLISVDDFAYCGHPPHLAQRVMKCLKPGACAVVECYVGLPSTDLATAFASSFAEPAIRTDMDLMQVFMETGLNPESDEDLTEEFLGLGRAGFKRLEGALAEAGGIDPLCARELVWEAEAWRMRLKLLAQRRLKRLRFVLRRPAEGPEAAPAATA